MIESSELDRSKEVHRPTTRSINQKFESSYEEVRDSQYKVYIRRIRKERLLLNFRVARAEFADRIFVQQKMSGRQVSFGRNQGNRSGRGTGRGSGNQNNNNDSNSFE